MKISYKTYYCTIIIISEINVHYLVTKKKKLNRYTLKKAMFSIIKINALLFYRY